MKCFLSTRKNRNSNINVRNSKMLCTHISSTTCTTTCTHNPIFRYIKPNHLLSRSSPALSTKPHLHTYPCTSLTPLEPFPLSTPVAPHANERLPLLICPLLRHSRTERRRPALRHVTPRRLIGESPSVWLLTKKIEFHVFSAM